MVDLSGLGDGTCGVWTTGQALAAGLTRSQVRTLAASGRWRRLRPAVFTDGGTEVDPWQRAWAAVLATAPDATAAGRTAARVHGLSLVDDEDPSTGRYEAGVDDVLSARGRPRQAGLVRHRWQLADDEVTTAAGCAVTTVQRTLWDLRVLLRPDALVCALDDALHRNLVTKEQLSALLDRYGPVAGRAAFAVALARADGRAESALETLVRLVVLPVLPSLEPQYQVRDRSGQLRARVDLGCPRLRLAVEADGGRWHSGPRRAADNIREEGLRACGWEVVRIGWHDVRTTPEAVRRRVLAAAQRRLLPAA